MTPSKPRKRQPCTDRSSTIRALDDVLIEAYRAGILNSADVTKIADAMFHVFKPQAPMTHAAMIPLSELV